MDIGSGKKLTRRGLLVLAASGAAGLAYLEFHHPPPEAVMSVPFVGTFTPIFVKPSQVIDLATWKLNLPTGSQQVTHPALSGFYDPFFQVTQAVQFTVTCGDPPQPGSLYPRSELREMNPDGSNASWSTTSGTHRMDLVQRVTHLPVARPKLVCGQIHSVTAYLILVVLDGPLLYVKYKDDIAGVLDDNYQLGTYFELSVQASAGYADVFYNGAHLIHQPMAEDQCYFKAGCYLQSNTSTGDLPTAYGQVEITSMALSHS